MVYITVKQSPMYRQMTLEELLYGNFKPVMISNNCSNTRTYATESVSPKFLNKFDISSMILKLVKFNESTESLRNHTPRSDLYHSFRIPKRSGGLRRIDAPNDDLMNALRQLKSILEDDFGALYHTSAFAYVKKRCTVDAVKKHQANESRWFGKYDLSNFFGSTTLDFVMKMLSMIFPFSEIMKESLGRSELEKALSLAFLNGGLPQGTPLSPTLTNIMMIPIDYKLTNTLRDYNRQRFVYTRYADDFIISSRYDFDFKKIEELIVETIKKFDAPFTIKASKTRYGSSSGANWNLGVMLNSKNEITVGHKKKRQFQAMLSSYVMDSKNGIRWDISDIQAMEGYRNYYRSVEKNTIDTMVKHVGEKFGVDIVSMIKKDLNNCI